MTGIGVYNSSAPARGVFAVTASPDAQPHTARGFRVGTAGNVTFVCPDDSTATIACVAGEVVPIEVYKFTACPAGLLGFI